MVERDMKRCYDRFRVHIMARAALLALAQAQLGLAGASARKWSMTALLGPVVLLVSLLLAAAVAVYTLLLAGLLDAHLGCSFPTVMLSPRMMACCIQHVPLINDAIVTMNFSQASCGKLDEEPGIFELVVNEASYAGTYDDPLALAWGRYPPEGYHMQATMGNFMAMLGVAST
jgi:hypothetical protein